MTYWELPQAKRIVTKVTFTQEDGEELNLNTDTFSVVEISENHNSNRINPVTYFRIIEKPSGKSYGYFVGETIESVKKKLNW